MRFRSRARSDVSLLVLLFLFYLLGKTRAENAAQRPARPRPVTPTVAQVVVDPCERDFDVCACSLDYYEILTLKEQIASLGRSASHRRSVASNIESSASYYKERFWLTRDRLEGQRALKYYDAYLLLAAPSDTPARYAILHSAAIYCRLGCARRARQMVAGISKYGGVSERELDEFLGDCR